MTHRHLTRSVVWLSCFLVTCGSAAAQETRPPLPVYVTGRVLSAAQADVRQKRQAAKDAAESLDKTLKAKYGRDRKAWPEHERQAWARAEADRWEAEHDVELARSAQHDIDDSVADLKKALEGAGGLIRARAVKLVESRDEAVVVAEVLGRRSSQRQSVTDYRRQVNHYFVTVKLSPGPMADASRFAALKPDWPYLTRQIRAAHPDAPYWIVESEAELRWLFAADNASAAVNVFAQRAHDAVVQR